MKRHARLITLLFVSLSLSLTASAQVRPGKTNKQPGGRLPKHVAEFIGFENLAPGTVVSTVFSNLGTGPVLISGFNPDIFPLNAAVIFDSGNPSGNDFDLGTPNETSFGPGIGVGGEFGMPFQNVAPLGHVLIIAEDRVDTDMDGLVDDPDDADAFGGLLEFDFTAVAPVTIHGFTILDVDDDRLMPTVQLFDENDVLIDALPVPITGNNGVTKMVFGAIDGIWGMRVILNGSGAIDNIDFERQRAKIGDTVFCDNNDNGIQDPDDPGLPGVTVEAICAGHDGVIGTADDIVETQDTDANGNYLFCVPPGPCQVGVVASSAPPDKVLGRCPTPLAVDLESGEIFLDADFCFINVAEIGDTVFCDLDDDGMQDPGEPGIPGVTVNLTCAGDDGLLDTADDYTDSQVTDANGNYLFTDLVPDECRVDVDESTAPDGKVTGQCPVTYTVVLGPADSFLDADFCFISPGEIGDTVFCDIDNDGFQDPDEPGIPGVTVLLTCAGPDGILGTGDDILDSQVTDADGHYLFENILADLCTVTLDPATTPAGKVPGLCPDSFSINLGPAESYLDADFCFITPGQIGDTVFCDPDLDGMQSPGEPGIEGVTVNLTCAGPDGMLGTADDYTDSQTTDADGHYLFENIPPGDCEVMVDSSTAPPDKVPGVCPTTVAVDLQAGQSFLDADFCFNAPPGEVGDTVFCDINSNGIQDPGEPGIMGVVVTLTCSGPDGVLGNMDDLVFMAVTDVDGHYLFTNVPAGMCEASVDVSTGPPDKVPGPCPLTIAFALGGGESFLDADFCFSIPADCCANGGPASLTMMYTGEDCSATVHSQDPDKVNCDGDPAFAPTIHLLATDKENPNDNKAKIWFDGDVDLDSTFVIDAANDGQDKLKAKTFLHITSLQGDPLQSIEFHTSCSQPLMTGNQFGSALLLSCGGPGLSDDLCDAGKPKILTMRYTGQDCSFTSHTQDPDKVNCDGDPAFAPIVQVLATDKEDPNDGGALVWFSGDVNLNTTFEIDATNAGQTRLKAATFVHITDLLGNTLQSIEFHTSCSQPLELGNQFGSLLLEGFIAE